MDNIAEFILQTAEEAKRRGLEICIASVQVAPQKPESKPVAEPARTPPVTKETVREQGSWIRVAEAARMLRCTVSPIYRRIWSGQLETSRDENGKLTVRTDILNGLPKFQSSHSQNHWVKVRCKETGVVYPSLTAAAKAMQVHVTSLREGVMNHTRVKNLTFEKV